MCDSVRLAALQFIELSAALLPLALGTAALTCRLNGVRSTDIKPRQAPAPSYTPHEILHDYLKCSLSHFPSLNTCIYKILLLPVRSSARSTDKSV